MYYVEFFRLKEAPFSIAPDPRYLFMSERHREGLAHLLYGVVNGNGFVALTGEVGTGKTTLCNCLLDQLPGNIDLALVLNPRVNAEELLATLCDELEITYPKNTTSLKVLIDTLTNHLLKVHAQGRHTVLLIDEAQNLSIDVLEQIRLLTNLETHDTKLLQIILVGQPELNQLLAQKNLRQLNQRITARYHIDPLSLAECTAYIDHRLKVAGAGVYPVFSKRAVIKVFQFSGGVPRLINIICERAMLGAYSLGTERVSAVIAEKAAREVLLPGPPRSRLRRRSVLELLVAGGFSALLFFGLWPTRTVEMAQDGKAVAESSGTDQPTSRARFGSDTRIFEKIFPGFVSLIQPGLGFDTAKALPGDAVPPVRKAANRAGESKGTAGQYTSVTSDQLRIPFVEAISDPDLDLNAALPHLFDQWNIRNEPSSHQFCESAQRFGLQCLRQHGTWDHLVNLNRPATLEFEPRQGLTRYATVIGVDREMATFVLASDKPVSFPIAEVLPFWQGKFALLWKPPAPATFLLLSGYSHPAVKWLRETMATIRGTSTETSTSILFDERLEQEVISFQSDHGLKADGKVGAETIILLNTLSESPNIPKLTQKSR